MVHYLYHRHQPRREGLRWAWKVEVHSRPGGDRIGEYAGLAWSRRGATAAARLVIEADHTRRATYKGGRESR